MAAELDTLINQGLEDAPEKPTTGKRAGEEHNVMKPVPPEPDEPPLASETAPVRMNGFRRRMEQRAQATERRLTFARAMVSTGWDEAKSLAAAGYTPDRKRVSNAVQQLMNHPDVISEIRRLRLVIEQRADVDTIDLAREWVNIASSDIFDYFDEVYTTEEGVRRLNLKSKAEMSKASRKAVKAIKIRRQKRTQKDGELVETEDIEIQLWDKHAALDSLAKVQGLYSDKRADAINNLSARIAERTERARKKIGRIIDAEPVS